MGPCAAIPESLVAAIGVAAADYPAGRLFRCRDCGLGQRQPCLGDEQLAEAYRRTPAETMDYPYQDNCAWTTARDVLLNRWNAGSARKVLDIGCHTGAFLEGLPKAWQRFGVESAEAPVQVARSERQIEVIAGRIEAIGSEWDGQFDAITLFDVVEHLTDPAAALQRVAALLRPGGLLIASSADLDAWTFRVAAGRHWYLQAPLHLSIASRRFYRYAARRIGLDCTSFVQVAHRRGQLSTRLRERAELLHWEARERGGWYRIPQRLLQGLPGLRQLRHRQAVPWTMRLKDHLVAVMERSMANHSNWEHEGRVEHG